MKLTAGSLRFTLCGFAIHAFFSLHRLLGLAAAYLRLVRPMNRTLISFLAVLLGTILVAADTPTYMGLTQAQLARKVGFPLRVYTLPADAQGGPAILFWVYYQRSPSGTIEEKEFGFQHVPLKVCYTSTDIDSSRFLSLEKDPDSRDIFRYNAQRGR